MKVLTITLMLIFFMIKSESYEMEPNEISMDNYAFCVDQDLTNFDYLTNNNFTTMFNICESTIWEVTISSEGWSCTTGGSHQCYPCTPEPDKE